MDATCHVLRLIRLNYIRLIFDNITTLPTCKNKTVYTSHTKFPYQQKLRYYIIKLNKKTIFNLITVLS